MDKYTHPLTGRNLCGIWIPMTGPDRLDADRLPPHLQEAIQGDRAGLFTEGIPKGAYMLTFNCSKSPVFVWEISVYFRNKKFDVCF